jgi:uncharacterized protein YjiS (DUF1127 family)
MTRLLFYLTELKPYARLLAWVRIRRENSELANMDDHQLKDLGYPTVTLTKEEE